MTSIPSISMELLQTLFSSHFIWLAGFVVTLLIYSWRRPTGSLLLPPGPPGLPVVGSLPFLDPELHTYFLALAKIYGPIYKIKLGSKLGIVISSPSLAREALRDNDVTLANRHVPRAGCVIAYGGSDIAWTPNGPVWRMLRRVCVQQMLSPASLDAVYHLRRREVMSTVHHFHNSAGKPVDVGAQVFLSVLNVITSVLWGSTVEEDKSSSSAIGIEFRELVGEITKLLGKPNVSDFFPSLARLDLQGVERKMKVLLGRFDGIFARIIDQRRKSGKSSGRKDLLGFMLDLEAEGVDSNIQFTITHVKALLMDMVVGGTDTTSNTIEWVMTEMMNKPESIKKAQDELDRVVGPGNIVEESHISKLRYLSSVIKEVLRLHPVVSLLPRCPSSSCTIGGYTIPKSSVVLVNVWAIHRDPSIWDNPNEFKPERFFDTSHKWDYSGNDFNYFPFGSGRRICAGISMAERMTMYSLASLLHNFDWKLEEGGKVDLKEKYGLVLKKAKPLIAIPTPRFDNLQLYK